MSLLKLQVKQDTAVKVRKSYDHANVFEPAQ